MIFYLCIIFRPICSKFPILILSSWYDNNRSDFIKKHGFQAGKELRPMFRLRTPQPKIPSRNKTVYLPDTTIQEIEKIAGDNDTSFNNVVVSMLHYCLAEKDSSQEAAKP